MVCVLGGVFTPTGANVLEAIGFLPVISGVGVRESSFFMQQTIA